MNETEMHRAVMFDVKRNNLLAIPNRISLEAFLGDSSDIFDISFTTRPEEMGHPIWICGGQPPVPTLRQALDFCGFLSEQQSVGVITLASTQFDVRNFASEVAESSLRVAILCIPNDCQDAQALGREIENALFHAGVRKHPSYYNIRGYEALNDRGMDFIGIYEPLGSDTVKQFPITFLKERRELHMDMLREEGMRSDAHVIRYVFGAEQIDPSSSVIIDACCGYGYGSAVLAHFHPCSTIFAVDVDAEAITYGRKIYSLTERINFICSDLLVYLKSLPANSVDAVCMFEGMEHLEHISTVLEEINRVLALSGKLIISVPNRWVNEEGVDPNPFHVRVYDWDNTRATLSESLNLERCFCQIGSRLNDNGRWIYADRRFVEVDPQAIDPGNAEWWLAIASKRIEPTDEQDRLRGQSSLDFSELIRKATAPEVAAVSFDVFDTLLVRPTLLPEDIFQLLQSELIAERGELFKKFAKLRQVAEAEVRTFCNAAGVEDILLSEIYSRLRDYLLIGNDEANDLMERELAVEERLLRPRQPGKLLFEAARAAGKKVIIASDIYLTRAQLQRLLAAHGFNGADGIYVSGELRMQKRRGTLFDKILQDMRVEGIIPEQILHVGDNQVSDVERPKEKGIMAALFTKNTDAYTNRTAVWPSGPQWKSASELDFGLRSFNASLIGAVFEDPFRKFVRGSTFDENPFLYGALRLAPFVFFAMLDFIGVCQRQGIKRVYFVTRDGHLPRAVFNEICGKMPTAIETEDLHISRRLVQLLEIEDLTTALRCLSNNLSEKENVVFGNFISELVGGPAYNIVDDANWAILTFLNRTVDWSSFDIAQSHLRTLWPKIEPLWAEQRRRLKDYISQCFSGIDPSECAVWDVGYFHTIGKSFSRLGYTIGLSGHLVEISHHKNRNSAKTTAFQRYSYLGAINNTQDVVIYDTSRHSVYLELLLSDPTSATRATFDRNGRPIVMTEKSVLRERNAEVLCHIHNGVLTAVNTVLRDFAPWLSDLGCSPQQAFRFAFAPNIMKELAKTSNMVFDNGRMINFSDLDV